MNERFLLRIVVISEGNSNSFKIKQPNMIVCYFCEDQKDDNNSFRISYNDQGTSDIRCCFEHLNTFVCENCQRKLITCICGNWMLFYCSNVHQCTHEFDDKDVGIWRCCQRICLDCYQKYDGCCYTHR